MNYGSIYDARLVKRGPEVNFGVLTLFKRQNGTFSSRHSVPTLQRLFVSEKERRGGGAVVEVGGFVGGRAGGVVGCGAE